LKVNRMVKSNNFLVKLSDLSALVVNFPRFYLQFSRKIICSIRTKSYFCRPDFKSASTLMKTVVLKGLYSKGL
jgi:hypothetical protein